MPKAKKTTISKSNFIRSQPATLSAAEVVAKGKAQGIKFAPQLVYNVRRRAKKPSKAVASATKTTDPKKTPPPSKAAASTKSPPATSKADFVRARSHLSPKEIVEDAEAAGLKLDASYVYNVRGRDETVDRRKLTKEATRAKTALSVPRPIATASKAETLLIAVAAEIGLGRAMEILAWERARVRAVIGG